MIAAYMSVIVGMATVSAAHRTRCPRRADWLTIGGGALVLAGAFPLLLGVVL